MNAPTIQHHYSDADVQDTIGLCVKLAPSHDIAEAFRVAHRSFCRQNLTNKETIKNLTAILFSGLSFGNWPTQDQYR